MTAQVNLPLSPLLEKLRPLLTAESRPVYLVGGTVRDALMDRAIHDIDLAVADDAIGLTFRLARALGLPAFVLDDERDVGRIVVPGDDLTLDIARFRGPTLEDDLRGRDFTINAMALPAGKETAADVIDLHGGLDDLRARRVRAVHSRSIADDPVRALRAARFAAQLGFAMTGETAAAAAEAAPQLAGRVSAERIRDELTRILLSPAPQQGVATLHELGLLAAVLPDVAALDGVAQSPPHHEDVYRHTLSVLRFLPQVERAVNGEANGNEWSADVVALLAPYRAGLIDYLERGTGNSKGLAQLRWGGLLHDAGKRSTQTIEDGGRIRFFGHDQAGAEIVRRVLGGLSFSNEATKHVSTMVAGHMRPLQLALDRRPPSRRAVYRYFRALRESGVGVCLLTLADHLATYDGRGDEQGWEALLVVVGALLDAYYNDHERIVAPPRLIDGRELMEVLQLSAGQEVGRLLRLLEEAQAAGEVTTREEAIAFARRHRRE